MDWAMARRGARRLTMSRAVVLLAVVPAVVAGLTGDVVSRVIYDAAVAAMAGIGLVVAFRRRTWRLVALAIGTFALGDVLFDAMTILVGEPPGASIADVAYLSGYPLLAFAVAATVWTSEGGPTGLLDGLVLSIPGGLVLWQFLGADALFTDGRLLDRTIWAAYPMLDLALVVGCVWLVLAGRPSRRQTLLLAGMGLMLPVDIGYYLAGKVESAWMDWLDPLYPVSYALVVLAVVQPDDGPARSGTGAAPHRLARDRHRLRMILLGGAVLASPLVGVIASSTGSHIDAGVLVLASVLISSLVVVRLALLLAEHERARATAVDLGLNLQHQATHDALTGLLNRPALLAELEMLTARGEPCAVLFVDLDRFKLVNDSLGHQAGDLLLTAVAGRLRQCVGADDALGRIGGDEFVVISAGMTGSEAKGMAATILERLEQPFALEGRHAVIGASVGYVVWAGGRDHSPAGAATGLLRDANLALHHAKRTGRRRVAVFDESLRAWAQGRLDTELALRRSLARPDFVLHYQPVVSASDGSLVSVEALLRWARKGHPMAMPDSFLAAAEDAGLMVELGDWVLREAVRQLRAWRAASLPREWSVAINVHRHQLLDPGFVGRVAKELARAGLPPRSLVIEVNENALLGQGLDAAGALAALAALGVGLAIDDFGAGFSSLAHLRSLPFNQVKLDRVFVADIADDPVVAAGVIEVAHGLGREVVAEGVETEAEAALLRQLGCDSLQGFLFARPLPADELVARVVGSLSAPLRRSETSRPA